MFSIVLLSSADAHKPVTYGITTKLSLTNDPTTNGSQQMVQEKWFYDKYMTNDSITNGS
jgi:hypothetical protein